MQVHDQARRRFLGRCGLLLGGWAIAGTSLGQAALKPLPANHPTAKALAYTAKAGTPKHPRFVAGSTCANCALFNAKTRACSLFPGYAVAPAGWCLSWAKKA